MIIEFEGLTTELIVDIESPELKSFDISFSGDMMVQFTRQESGEWIATNGVDGHGKNIIERVYGKKPKFTKNKP